MSDKLFVRLMRLLYFCRQIVESVKEDERFGNSPVIITKVLTRQSTMTMQKKMLAAMLLMTVALTSQAQELKWEIHGSVANAEATDTLEVIDMEKQRPIVTLHVKNGKISSANGTLNEPAVCGIWKEGLSGWICAFVLEDGTVNIDIDQKKRLCAAY